MTKKKKKKQQQQQSTSPVSKVAIYCYYGEGAVKQSNEQEGSFLSIVRGDIGQVMDDVFPK